MRYDCQSGSHEVLFRVDQPLCTVALDKTGIRMLFGCLSGTVHLSSADGAVKRDANVSNKAVTDIVWDTVGARWITAGQDGSIRLLAADDLKVMHEIKGPGPIWDIAIDARSEATTLAVAANSPEVILYDLSKDGRSTSLTNRLRVPSRDTGGGTAHAVCFGKGDDSLYAINNELQLVCWSRATAQILWTSRYAVSARNVREKTKAISPESLANRFSRVAGAVLSTGAGLVTAGHDMALKCWDTRVESGVRQIVLPSPNCVAFDASNESILWAGASDGSLSCINCEAGEVRAVRKHAHGAQITAVCAPAGLREVVTSSRDHYVRFWRLKGPEIQESKPAIRHTSVLLSLAASHNSRWLAAVDSQSQVLIWDIASRKLLFRDRIVSSPHGEPLTGKLAFSYGDNYLAAFGAGQTSAVYAAGPFRRLRDEVRVAGSGGTAMAWLSDPTNHFVASDTEGRIAEVVVGGQTTEVTNALTSAFHDAPCISIADTPGNRRLILLDARGRFIVYDPKHDRVLLERTCRYPGARQIVVDRSSRRVAIAHDVGSIELWDTAIPQRHEEFAQPKDQGRWRRTSLLRDVPGLRCDPMRMVQTDGDGHVAIAYFRDCALQSFEGTANLRVASDRGGVTRIESVSDRGQLSPNACRLALIADETALAYRRRLKNGDPYAGDFVLARRSQQGTWVQTVLERECNAGFFPCFAIAGNSLSGVLHFDFNGNYGCYTSREDETWHTERVGAQGDGYALIGVPSARSCHFIFAPQKFGSDRSPPQYICWDKGVRLQDVIDPTVNRASAITVGSDEQPIALVSHYSHPERPVYSLAFRHPNGWQLQPLPVPWTSFRNSIACDLHGRIHLVGQNPTSYEIVHWTMDKNRWQAEIVDRNPTHPCDWVIINLDRKGRPIVIACFTANERSDVDVYRTPAG